jgi:hypothetical protein
MSWFAHAMDSEIAAVVCVFDLPCSGIGTYPHILLTIVEQAYIDRIINYSGNMEQDIA